MFRIYEKFRWTYNTPPRYYIYQEGHIYFENQYLDAGGRVSNNIKDCLFSDLYTAARVLRNYYREDEQHIKFVKIPHKQICPTDTFDIPPTYEVKRNGLSIGKVGRNGYIDGNLRKFKAARGRRAWKIMEGYGSYLYGNFRTRADAVEDLLVAYYQQVYRYSFKQWIGGKPQLKEKY